MSQTRAQLLKGFTNTSAPDDAIIVSSAGNVSVGSTLNDSVGSTTTLTIDRSSGNGQISFAANGTVRGRIFADNSTSEFRIGNPTNDDLMLYTNNLERCRILAAGGLTFNGDTAAANALDDYEEGDWTPDLRFGGNKVGITYNNQYGKYVKIGRLVHVFGRINLSSKGSSGGNAQFFGLPYVTETITGTTMNIGSIWYSGFNLQGSIVQVVMRTDGNGQSFIEPKGVTTNAEDAIGDSDFTNGTDMCFSVTYRTT